MIWIIVTFSFYIVGTRLYKRFPTPFMLPILVVTLLLICLFLILGLSHDEYLESGGEWLSAFLGPAIVSLAIPLYKQRAVLLKNFSAIFIGILSGIVTLLIIHATIGQLLHIDQNLLATAMPQLATMPLAIYISEQIGGIPAMTSAFVVIAGIGGGIVGPFILKALRITDTVGRGVAMGCASHIVGVTQLAKDNQDEAAVASVAMIITGLLAVFLIPLGIKLLF